jgi:hypothetical protein
VEERAVGFGFVLEPICGLFKAEFNAQSHVGVSPPKQLGQFPLPAGEGQGEGLLICFRI